MVDSVARRMPMTETTKIRRKVMKTCTTSLLSLAVCVVANASGEYEYLESLGVGNSYVLGIDANGPSDSPVIVATEEGAFIVRGSDRTELIPQSKDLFVLDAAYDSHAQLWLGTSSGLFLRGGDAPDSELEAVIRGTIIEDIFVGESDESVWVGTGGYGIARVDMGENNELSDVTWFGLNSGLPSEYVLSVFRGHHDRGMIWAGTERGLAFSSNGGASWNVVEGLAERRIFSIDGSSEGVLVGTDSGAYFGVGDDWEVLPNTEDLLIRDVGLLQDKLLVGPSDERILVFERMFDGLGVEFLAEKVVIESSDVAVDSPGLTFDVREIEGGPELYIGSLGDGVQRMQLAGLVKLGILEDNNSLSSGDQMRFWHGD